mmetsp:Transcript_13602/g.39196  ORF Transcript_13602/g.39196 Transcript_13602/m.39196 type:complete len:84 (+) Transcript_13602:162-413(+)
MRFDGLIQNFGMLLQDHKIVDWFGVNDNSFCFDFDRRCIHRSTFQEPFSFELCHPVYNALVGQIFLVHFITQKTAKFVATNRL